MKKFLFITAISLFLVSCSCEYHYSKLQKNCASFIITNNDTIILPEIHIDTMVRTDTAKILGIPPCRMRQIADKYPHIKRGDHKQGQLLFERKSRIRSSIVSAAGERLY